MFLSRGILENYIFIVLKIDFIATDSNTQLRTRQEGQYIPPRRLFFFIYLNMILDLQSSTCCSSLHVPVDISKCVVVKMYCGDN